MAGFVCIHYGNTGSSWLLDALAVSPQVFVPGFEPVEGWAWDAPEDVRLDWLRTALSPPEEHDGPRYESWVDSLQASPQVDDVPRNYPFDHVGLKMNALAVFATDEVADVLDEAEAKVIMLTRENRIRHALSLYRYHEEGKSQFGEKGVKPPTRVRLGRFNHWLNESARLHRESIRVRKKLVERLGADRLIDVSYEQFTTDQGKQSTIDWLCGFLEIEPIEVFEGHFVKATSDDLRSAVVNYNALRLRYALTPMRRHFHQ